MKKAEPFYKKPPVMAVVAVGALLAFAKNIIATVAGLVAFATTPQGLTIVAVAGFLLGGATFLTTVMRR